jgi:hypothetical protein
VRYPDIRQSRPVGRRTLAAIVCRTLAIELILIGQALHGLVVEDCHSTAISGNPEMAH